jgi:hypothetical protein
MPLVGPLLTVGRTLGGPRLLEAGLAVAPGSAEVMSARHSVEAGGRMSEAIRAGDYGSALSHGAETMRRACVARGKAASMLTFRSTIRASGITARLPTVRRFDPRWAFEARPGLREWWMRSCLRMEWGERDGRPVLVPAAARGRMR